MSLECVGSCCHGGKFEDGIAKEQWKYLFGEQYFAAFSICMSLLNYRPRTQEKREPYGTSHSLSYLFHSFDWWVDQDWLCVCNEYKHDINNGALGFLVKLYDAGSKYNWIIRNGSNEVIEQINSKEKVILHLKGGSFTRWTIDSKKTSNLTYKKYIDLIV